MKCFNKILKSVLLICLFLFNSSFEAKAAKKCGPGKKHYQPKSSGAMVFRKCCPGYKTVTPASLGKTPVCAKKGSNQAICVELKNTVNSSKTKIKKLQRDLRKLKRTLKMAEGFYKAGKCK